MIKLCEISQMEELIAPLEEVQVEEKVENQFDLIIYNDDVNTFEFVIESLVKICKHNSLQAEQCTMIIHNNGKCSVKRGDMKSLQPMHEAFLDRGISSKIEN